MLLTSATTISTGHASVSDPRPSSSTRSQVIHTHGSCQQASDIPESTGPKSRPIHVWHFKNTLLNYMISTDVSRYASGAIPTAWPSSPPRASSVAASTAAIIASALTPSLSQSTHRISARDAGMF